MTQVIVAAQDTPADMASVADIKCDFATDMTQLARVISKENQEIELLIGNYNLNGGTSRDPKGGGYLRPGAGTTVAGTPLNTFLRAASSMVRITIDKPNVSLSGFSLIGCGHIQAFGTARSVLLEDITIQQSLDRKTWLNLGPKGGCTAAFLFYAAPGQVLQDVKVRRCRALMAYHHGFSAHVYNAQQGAEFKDFLIEDCLAESCGAGFLVPRDWACGFLFADTGNVTNLTVRRCWAVDNIQSGFHADGNWSGHAQKMTNVRYEDCHAEGNGVRCPPEMEEKFRCGFYMQSGTFVGCTSKNNAGPGFGIKNEVANSLVIEDCSDDGSLYGLILEYAGRGAKVKFVSKNAVRRAFQGQVLDGTLELTLVNPPATGITFGRTQRIDYLDCPNHAAEVKSKYDVSGPWNCTGTAITLRCASRPGIEVWKSSKVDMNSIMYRPLDIQEPLPVDDTTVPPHPLPNRQGSFVYGPFKTVRAVVKAAGRDVVIIAEMPLDLQDYFTEGAEYVPKEI